MAEHVAAKKIYYFVFGALLLLTLLTWQIAYVDLGEWNTVVVLVIAALKAGLVATFFMHLRWSASMMRIVICVAVFWLIILITLSLSDILTRRRPEAWQPRASATQIVPATSRLR